ncbi:hypothetical protein [Phaffia rhodozyma]|uniref:Uncharacterized protein n=1 Tax=Phaffia rhodozyma TaxID=264483 RepID=A0A0F7SLM9_PHARH|nr:hypothetical protein [Phaffia rhodozyma]
MEYSSLLRSIWRDVRSEDSPALALSLSFAIIVALFRFRNTPNIVLALSLLSLTEALLCSNPSFIDLTDFPTVVPYLLPKAHRVAWLLLFVAAPALVQSVLGLALLIRSTWLEITDQYDF